MRTNCFYGTQKMSAAVGVLLFTVVGCTQPLSTREKSTLAGGGLGAATGAIIGAAVGAPGAGAVGQSPLPLLRGVTPSTSYLCSYR